MDKYFPVIGLEIHVELKTKSKMFCSCKNDSQEKRPNVNICPICLGYPGTLPTINEEALKKVLKVGKALNCQIPKVSFFERKNYFYPDLPKGYQISQYQAPLCINGYLELENSKLKKIRIRRIHLEEDTARLLHEKNYSLVDFNRAGIPLMELVTEPDLRSSKEARKFGEKLRTILRYLDVSDADMEKGQMRIEANVSLSEIEDPKKLGTKVEIKNLNSFKEVERAIEFEIKRQKEILSSGKKVFQETRGWDDIHGITFSQREKEEAHDYRYFPEPDLPPLDLEEFLSKIILALPELPDQKSQRYQREFFISKKEAEILVKDKEASDFFEKAISELELWMKDENLPQDQKARLYQIAFHLILSDIKGILGSKKIDFQKMRLTPENFAELIILLWEGKVSIKVAKELLERMIIHGGDPSQIIESEKLTQVVRIEEIEKVVKEVLLENPKAVKDYKEGKTQSIHFLFGKAMGKTKGKLNPQILKEILEKELKKL